MITSLLNWLDHRAGLRKFIGMMILEGVPGGARWRYVWGSCLAFVFSLQLITGVMLMTAYSPSASQAWNTVHSIQYKMDFGWLIRGLHHFGSQTMMVLIALHMLQVVIAGAHLPPREVNWWLGIGLLSITFGLSLTGYLLPWDQKGYWATDVATNIAGTLPKIGAEVKQQAVGGADSGNYTLTRFYALHVAILPGALILLLIAHIAIFRRHGVTSKENPEGLVTRPDNEHAPGTEPFWPRQAFYDMIACMVVFAIMLSLVLYGFAHEVEPPPSPDGAEPGLYEKLARMGVKGKGAELDAGADRDTAGYPARPEWYFLFLFQLLKYFPGDYAIIGTVIIPNGVMVLLFLLPFFGAGPLRKFGHFFGVLVVMTLLIMVGLLTLKALDDDQPDGILWGVMKRKPQNPDDENDEAVKAIKAAKAFQHRREEAEALAKRACQMAMAGTPVQGGHVLLRNDPLTAGRKLFEQKCGSCHGFTAMESDKFRRILEAPISLQPKLEAAVANKDLADLRKTLKDKGILVSEKFQVKAREDGKHWDIEDAEFDRTFEVVNDHGALKFTTKAMTDGRTASDLGDWGRESWVKRLLISPHDPKIFGLVMVDKLDEKGKPALDEKGNKKKVPGLNAMKAWRKRVDNGRENKKIDGAVQDKEFDAIARWLAYQATPKEKRIDDEISRPGIAAFFEEKRNKCSTCHAIEARVFDKQKKAFIWEPNEGDGLAPSLVDYGSAEWLRSMIMQPAHKSKFGAKNSMPAFRAMEGPGSEIMLPLLRDTSEKSLNDFVSPLTDMERELIIRFILRDDRPIYGDAPIR